jgi:succinyl-diaminopimelate desuccinylase
MELSSQVEQCIENRKEDLVNLCSSLIKAKSENPPGDVSEASTIVEDFLTKNDLKYQRLEPKGGRVNILVTVGGGPATLILCGHVDVVPAGDVSRWSFDPFSGEVKEGEVLGRGATDMKGGLSAMLTALVALKRVEEQLHGKVLGAIVCDEEVGGRHGVQWLFENGKLSGDACLIAEPSSYMAAGCTIEAGERGVCWFKLKVAGQPAHGSWPMLGDNAILKMSNLLPKLKSLERKVQTPTDALPLVENGKKILERIADARSMTREKLTWILDHYTVNVGVIKGGTKTNVVPEYCEVDVDVRIPIGGSEAVVKEELEKIIPESASFEVYQRAPPSYSSINERLVGIVKRNVDKVFGVDAPPIAIWATADAWRFRERGIPTVIFGPGYVEKAHAYDETVPIDDLIKSSRVYAHSAIEYLRHP